MDRTPFLDGDQVALYPVEEADLERLRDIVNDEAVWHWISINTPQNLQNEQAFLEQLTEDDTQTTLLIYDKDAGARAGTVELMQEDAADDVAELGIVLDTAHHSKGVGTEAVERMLAYGFDERNLHKIWARVQDHNEKSRGLLEKCGFTEEGRLREHTFAGGQRRDFVLYGLLRDEWRE